MQFNKKKHPFYGHSDADFFIATKDGKDVGCIAVIENKLYNEYQKKKQASFYLFDTIDDLEVAEALFNRAYEWARERGLNQIVGPKGFGPLDGYGILTMGFEHRQMMTMMKYNYPYYPEFMEKMGFRTEVDFLSCYFDLENAREIFPQRIHRIADRVKQRGTLQVKEFKSKKELASWGHKIGHAYNKAFVNNWEYYPLTDKEIDYVVENILVIADPKLFKIITHGDEVVGFLFSFKDISLALQRCKGKMFPFGVFHILWELNHTKWISFNGTGILPEFQGRGGNAIMYSEMAKAIESYPFKHGDMPQVAETTWEMRQDLKNIGGEPYKNHRVYIKDI
jgi:GNAT superfamily N-acetyltransferase